MSQAMLLLQTTRRLMYVIAGVALLVTIARSCRPASGHGYYFANTAASCRRLERWFRQQATLAREASEEARRKQAAAGLARDGLLGQVKREEEEASRWEGMADELAKDATDALMSSRKNGDLPWELPEHLRCELKPEDLIP
jgi:hypothetical protein